MNAVVGMARIFDEKKERDTPVKDRKKPRIPIKKYLPLIAGIAITAAIFGGLTAQFVASYNRAKTDSVAQICTGSGLSHTQQEYRRTAEELEKQNRFMEANRCYKKALQFNNAGKPLVEDSP
jgi:hypothetical protein